jgi:hypothetical protein
MIFEEDSYQKEEFKSLRKLNTLQKTKKYVNAL